MAEVKYYKEIRKKIEFPVFGYTIHIIFTTNVVEAIKLLNNKGETDIKEKDMPLHVDGGCHISNKASNVAHIVLYYKGGIATAVHESYHAIYRLMDYVGIKDEEAFAYHLDYLASEITEMHNELVDSNAFTKKLIKQRKKRKIIKKVLTNS